MSLKRQAINGVVWTFAQQFSVQIINFGVQIILARLLMPEMFGLIAMVSVFVSIGATLMDGGMTSSLIRTKNPDQLDYSTVFMTNMLVSIVAYLLTFVGAPYVAEFYDQEVLKNILRVFALSFIVRAFMAVHMTKLTKEMDFKTQMRIQIPSVIIGAIVGVSMAYMGYGVWSLVWMNLAQAIVNTLQCWFTLPWKPSFTFNKRRFRYHLNFGYKLTLSGLLDTIYNDAYRIVIGKFYSPASVGFFNQAETMRLFPVQQIGSVMGKVTYPLFANLDNDRQLKSAYKQTMKLVLFAVIPIMLVLIIVAEEFFLFLFGEKWLPAVPYFQILSVASIIRPISNYNLNILKVKGRSDLFLKVEIIKKVLGVIAIAIALPFGVMGLVISLTAVSYLFTLINMLYSGRLIEYKVLEQLGDIFRLFIIGVVVTGTCYYIKQQLSVYIGTNILMILSISLLYMLLYLSFIYLFDKNMIYIIKKTIKN